MGITKLTFRPSGALRIESWPGLAAKSSLLDLRRLRLRTSGKPEVRCHPRLAFFPQTWMRGIPARLRVFDALLPAHVTAIIVDAEQCRLDLCVVPQSTVVSCASSVQPFPISATGLI